MVILFQTSINRYSKKRRPIGESVHVFIFLEEEEKKTFSNGYAIAKAHLEFRLLTQSNTRLAKVRK